MNAVINIDMQLNAIIDLKDKNSKMLVKKCIERPRDFSFSLNIELGESFTIVGSDDLVSGGGVTLRPITLGNQAEIAFQGVVGISENYMGTIVPYFSKSSNEALLTSIDLTVTRNNEIESSLVFEVASPVKWALLGDAVIEPVVPAGSKRAIMGRLSIAWARLSRIESDDLLAEDDDQLIAALRDKPHFIDAINQSKSNVSAMWDLDSDFVSDLRVLKFNLGAFAKGRLPALKNVEIEFSCNLRGEQAEDVIKSEIMFGLMPILETEGIKFVFFDCDDLTCEFL